MSYLKKKSVEEILNNEYCFELISMREIDMGNSTCYQCITSRSDSLFVKVIDQKNAFMVEQEMEYLSYLKDNTDLSVYSVILNKRGESFTISNSKLVLVERYEQGIVFKRNECPDQYLMLSGKILGRIHFVSNEYLKAYKVMHSEWMRLYDKAEEKKIELIKKSELCDKNTMADLDYKQTLKSRIREYVILFDKVKFGMSHADYHCQQWIVNEGNITILDLTNCAIIPLCWEVLFSYIESAYECKLGDDIDVNKLVSYYNEYLKENDDFQVKKDILIAHKIYLFWSACNSYGYYQYYVEGKGEEYKKIGQRRAQICRTIEKKMQELDSIEL